ncbi:hypothetical protein OHB53_44525 [Streptomyces sp. NBC_00056]|uniref:hypothetical protein n=1 Tax=Streptomyces sp. NBC_00056 TaxID=2975633 RepID=UPI0032469A4B
MPTKHSNIVGPHLYGFCVCVRVSEGTGTATAPEAVGGIAADVAERVGDADGPTMTKPDVPRLPANVERPASPARIPEGRAAVGRGRVRP